MKTGWEATVEELNKYQKFIARMNAQAAEDGDQFEMPKPRESKQLYSSLVGQVRGDMFVLGEISQSALESLIARRHSQGR